MSPLWRDEVGIYLAPRRICLVRIQRGLRPKVTREENHADPGGSTGWEPAFDLLDGELASGHWSDARLRIVIADRWARFCTVPWSDALTSGDEQMAHARELMSGVFGEMSEWTVTLSQMPPGGSRLASAMPTKLLEALRGAAVRHGQTLWSVQPQLIASYNAWRHVLPAAAWFVTVEDGSLAALRVRGDDIDRVHAVRIGADWARELNRLQIFGRLASASPAEGRVYVDLPEALRAARPPSSSDLEWLEDANRPLTTLQRLEQLRRSAA